MRLKILHDGVIQAGIRYCLLSICTCITRDPGQLETRSCDNDSTGFWPPGLLHTLGADGHI